MRVFSLLALTAAAFAALAAPVAAATFDAESQTCSSDGVANSPVPVSSSSNCAPGFGAASANSVATFGRLGAAGTTSADGSSPNILIANGSAGFSDIILLTKTDSSASDQLSLSFNLVLNGSFSASAGSGGEAQGGILFATSMAGFGGGGQAALNTGIGFFSNIAGIAAPGAFNVNVVSATRGVDFLGGAVIPFSIEFSILSAGSAAGLAQASADATLMFPTNGPVFNLPAGYTVNAGNYLVDNRFIDPNVANPIPEPATWAMLIAGFGLTGSVLRIKRPSSRRSARSPG